MRISKVMLIPSACLALWACGDGETGGGDPDAGSSGNQDAGMLDTTCDPGFGQAAACGGDLSGAWTYRKACGSKTGAAFIQDLCAGATVRNEEVTSTQGTLTITGGSLSANVNATLSLDADIPTACVALVGDCPGVESAIEQAAAGSNATCTAVATGCTCAVTSPFSSSTSGTLSTSGGVATVNAAQTELYHYCIANGVLRYRLFDPEEGSVYVLTR